MPPSPDLVEEFADHVASMRFEALPADAVEAAKKSILDTVGVILAASGLEPAALPAVQLAIDSGGQPESTLLGFGSLVSAPMAAFGNGALAHCLDFDDQTPWGQHSSSTIVPAVLAVAECYPQITGREMIAAVAVGQDLFARLRCHVGWRKDWNLSTVLGVYAGAAAVARLLGLSATQTRTAFTLASMQSSGVMEVVAGTGSNVRAIYAAFPAQSAVLSGYLARSPLLTPVEALFEGPHGVMHTYFDGSYDRAAIVRALGTEFLGSRTLFKPWPAVGTSHSHVHAVVQIMKAHELGHEEIDVITAFVGDYHDLMCRPLEERRAPRTMVDAKFSLPYLLAVAAVKGTVGVADFSPAAITDPRVLAVARKVVPVADADLDWTLELPPGRVEIRTIDGGAFAASGARAPGGPDAPLGWSELSDKFSDCARAAKVAPSSAAVEEVIGMAMALEGVSCARDLVQPLSLPSE